MAATVHRNAIEGELQRFTLRVTRRTVPIMFSMMLVQASERRSSAADPACSPSGSHPIQVDHAGIWTCLMLSESTLMSLSLISAVGCIIWFGVL
jgi:hypothetical protein